MTNEREREREREIRERERKRERESESESERERERERDGRELCATARHPPERVERRTERDRETETHRQRESILKDRERALLPRLYMLLLRSFLLTAHVQVVARDPQPPPAHPLLVRPRCCQPADRLFLFVLRLRPSLFGPHPLPPHPLARLDLSVSATQHPHNLPSPPLNHTTASGAT